MTLAQRAGLAIEVAIGCVIAAGMCVFLAIADWWCRAARSRAVHITGAFVFVSFLVGAFHGAADAERKIAARCLAGERVQIASIQIKCPSRPVWRDQ